jgi:hypothetical protein
VVMARMVWARQEKSSAGFHFAAQCPLSGVERTSRQRNENFRMR